jgi:hypothetical protein
MKYTLADIQTYEDRIRRNNEKLKVEKDTVKRTILNKKILRDRINIELKRLHLKQ